MNIRGICAAAVVIAGTSGLGAQGIRGTVRDAETGAVVPSASISVAGPDTGRVATIVAGTNGQFTIMVPRPGVYTMQIRRLGYLQRTLEGVSVGNGLTEIAPRLESRPVFLDTVKTKAGFQLTRLTSGAEFVQRHLALGKGLIVGGAEIQLSGMRLSEYLGKLEGIVAATAPMPGSPMVPGEGVYLTSTHGAQCLYARVDRTSLFKILQERGARTIDDLLRLDEIMAVEIYRSIREAPPEWKLDGTVLKLYKRGEVGLMPYLIGHLGIAPVGGSSNPLIGVSIYADHTAKNFLANRHIPVCGFMQIWTRLAW